MRSLPSLLLFALVSAASFGGVSCSSSKAKDGVFDTPRAFEGFPADASVGIVQAEARFYVNHAELLNDYDMIERERVIPVAIRIGLRGAGMNEAQARFSTDGMLLFLPDGTALASRSYSKIEPRREKQRDALYEWAHKGGVLSNFDGAKAGLVFFALPKGYEYDEQTRSIVRIVDGVKRQVDLTKGVCELKVTVGDESQTLYVGLKADRRSERR